MSIEKRVVFRGLDKPVPIFFWDPMVFIVMTMVVGVGIIAKQLLLGIFGAYLAAKIAKKLARGAKRGQSKHALWRMGVFFIDPKLHKKMPHPVMTEFCE